MSVSPGLKTIVVNVLVKKNHLLYAQNSVSPGGLCLAFPVHFLGLEICIQYPTVQMRRKAWLRGYTHGPVLTRFAAASSSICVNSSWLYSGSNNRFSKSTWLFHIANSSSSYAVKKHGGHCVYISYASSRPLIPFWWAYKFVEAVVCSPQPF